MVTKADTEAKKHTGTQIRNKLQKRLQIKNKEKKRIVNKHKKKISKK